MTALKSVPTGCTLDRTLDGTLDCTLPSSLECSLPSAFPSTLPSSLPSIRMHSQLPLTVHSQVHSQKVHLSADYQARMDADLRSGRRWMGCGWRGMVSGRNHDVGRFHDLNLIFGAPTATRSHDISRSRYWQMQPTETVHG
jgi:hypothetical protein